MCSAQDGNTSNVALNSGGTITFVEKFSCLGNWVASDLTDRFDVTHRINKASGAFGALRKEFFGTKYASYEAKRKAHTGIVLSVLIFGCESWCFTADLVGTLASWHHARLREMCRSLCTRFGSTELPPTSFTNALESRASATIFACARCLGDATWPAWIKRGCRVGSPRHGKQITDLFGAQR